MSWLENTHRRWSIYHAYPNEYWCFAQETPCAIGWRVTSRISKTVYWGITPHYESTIERDKLHYDSCEERDRMWATIMESPEGFMIRQRLK